MSDQPKAYYSDEHRCWFVPVSAEMKEWAEAESESIVAEPCRVELRDGTLWITQLEVAKT